MNTYRIILRGVAFSILFLLAPWPSKADWSEGGPHKMHYPQLPDLSTNGMGVAAVQNGNLAYVLADDFLCTASGPITAVHIWGAWLNDQVDPNASFTLSIHSDIPAQGDEPSLPGPTLWYKIFGPGEFTVRPYATINEGEGWFDPLNGYTPPPADYTCYQYNFTIPPDVAFSQVEGTIYWLDVQASCEENYTFGWKTAVTNNHWMDDATFNWGKEPTFEGSPWRKLTYPQGHPFYPQTLDLAFVIEGDTPTVEPESKWWRPLDRINAVDIISIDGTNIVADDFLSDGRPITGIQWWGSYIGYGASLPTVSGPPLGQRPDGFHVRWYADVPAGVNAPCSMPGKLLADEYYRLSTWGASDYPVVEKGAADILWSWNGQWEHEFMYSLTLTNGPWLEKEGTVYWVSISTAYTNESPILSPWGWATTPLHYNWNDATIATNSTTGLIPLVYTNLDQNHPYGGASVNMAFSLITDVLHRRAKKWAQPADMSMGENMSSFRILNETVPGMESLRADDFISDGRPITDIHWWGSYLGFLTNFPGPVLIPPAPARPLYFTLKWYTDIPSNTFPGITWSMPGTELTNINISITNCHEVYYGTVTQMWKGADYYEHEFQYYVDLIHTPWLEESGTVYWVSIQAVLPTIGWQQLHNGWGWKTTPPENQWNDYSVISNASPAMPWLEGHYPGNHPYYPNPGKCDLAFELTTDVVGGGSNWWNQPILIRYIGQGLTPKQIVIDSMGDVGAGIQVLQQNTNWPTSPLSGNWTDVMTNKLPLPSPWTNTWMDTPMESLKIYRVIQR